MNVKPIHPLVSALRDIRQQAGVSQANLGLSCDPSIGQATINRIENGKMIPTIALFDRLCGALGYELDIMKVGE